MLENHAIKTSADAARDRLQSYSLKMPFPAVAIEEQFKEL
jgi:hypothetical protein